MQSFKQFNEDYEYNEYVGFLDSLEFTDNGVVIFEATNKFSKVIDFMNEFSIKAQMKVMDLVNLFRDKVVFKFLSAIDWSVKKFFSLIRDGYKYWGKIHNAIGEFIAERKIVKFTYKNLKEFDDWLEVKYPKLKKVSSYTLAGFLIYEWTSLISFTGNVKFDFDQSTLFKALKGKASFSDVFFSSSGVKMMLFIGTGVATGISFPWGLLAGTWTLFMASILYTIASDKYPEVADKLKKYIKSKSKSG